MAQLVLLLKFLKIFLGGQPISSSIGADEDDFHLVKRNNDHLDHFESRTRKDVKSGTTSSDARPGVVGPFGNRNVLKPRKVVKF
jgi:hypothetical protein